MVAALSTRPFVPLPVHLLRDTTLSDGALRLYAVLRDHAGRRGYCWPGQRRLAESLGRSEVTVRRWLTELVVAGLVIKQRRGLTRTNVYRIVNLAPLNPSPDKVIMPAPERNPAIVPERSPMIVKPDKEDQEQGKEIDVSTDSFVSSNVEGGGLTLHSGRLESFNTPDRAALLPYIRDISREMNDAAALSASLTRAVRLYRRSGVSLDEFVGHMLAARSLTQERSAAIRAVDRESGRKRKVAYWFSVLTDRLGLRDCPQEARALPFNLSDPAAQIAARLAPSVPSHQPMLLPPGGTIVGNENPSSSVIFPEPRWSPILDVMGLHDRIGYYRAVGSMPPLNPDAAVELARRRLRGQERPTSPRRLEVV